MFLDFFYSLALAGFISGISSFSVSCLSVFLKLIFLYFRNSLKGLYRSYCSLFTIHYSLFTVHC